MKVVTTVSNEQVAQMLVNELEDNGIKAFMQNEGTGDIFNGLAFADIPVAVRDVDYDKALIVTQKFLDNIDQNDSEE